MGLLSGYKVFLVYIYILQHDVNMLFLFKGDGSKDKLNGGLVPTYILISKWLHMSNTVWALICPILLSAWNIILMKGFFSAIPSALIESAKLDGASELVTFIKIIIPISTPAFATIALFGLLNAWNSWMPSMLYTENQKLFTFR